MTTAGQSRPGLSRALLSISVGISLGAVVVSLYTFTRRVPDGLISDRLGTASRFVAGSLIAVAVVATALAGAAVAAWLGRLGAGKAATLLCLICVVTAWCYLSASPRTWTVAITGPGNRPVVALVQTAWLLLAIAAVLLVAGAVTALGEHQPFKWQPALPLTIVGVVIALTAGYGLALLADIGAPHPTTAAPMEIPEFPRTLGNKPAYTVTAESIDALTPAGPGFVLTEDEAVIAYDGATGAERWRFPFTAFPDDCTFRRLRSTGTVPEAVVLAECVRTPEYGKYTDPYLVGLDSMTGRVLWTMDKGWGLRARTQLPPDAVPVASADELGSLNPRTGELRWARSLAELDQQCRTAVSTTMAVDHSIVHAASCGTSVRIHVLDATTGTDHLIEQPTAQQLDKGSSPIEPIASYGTVVAMKLSYGFPGQSLGLIVDTRTNTVTEMPSHRISSDYSSISTGQYPGPIVQLRPTTGTDAAVDLYRVADGITMHANGIAVYSVGNSFGPRSGQAWAEVGDQLVTAAVDNHGSPEQLGVVAPDGTSTRRTSPCGYAANSVVTVPGAVLIACLRTGNQSVVEYDIFGIPPA